MQKNWRQINLKRVVVRIGLIDGAAQYTRLMLCRHANISLQCKLDSNTRNKLNACVLIANYQLIEDESCGCQDDRGGTDRY